MVNDEITNLNILTNRKNRNYVLRQRWGVTDIFPFNRECH